MVKSFFPKTIMTVERSIIVSKNQTDPHNEAETVAADVRRIRPLQRMLLIDVLRDKGSRPVFYWAGSILLLGTFAYHWLEGWSYLDSLYFCVISLATIGYGDLAPTTPEARLFTIFYVINGIGILVALFDRIRVVRNLPTAQQINNKADSDTQG
jgi:voltage-gated potassium channel